MIRRRSSTATRMLPSRRTWAPLVVARDELDVEVGGVAVGEEHVAQHLDVDEVLVEDVAQREHRVGRLGPRERRVVACGHREEARAVPQGLVLDLVDEAEVALVVGHLDLDGVALDRGGRVGAVRLDRAQRERAAVGVGVVREHPHRDRAPGPHRDGVLDRDRGARAVEPRRDADADGAGRPRAERVDHGVLERVGARRVLPRLVLEPVAAARDDGAAFGARLLPEQLHRVAVGVGAAERDGDAHRLAGDHPGGDRLRNRGRVGLGVRLAHRDVHVRGGELPVGCLDAVRRVELPGLLGREVPQPVAGREEEPACGVLERGRARA